MYNLVEIVCVNYLSLCGLIFVFEGLNIKVRILYNEFRFVVIYKYVYFMIFIRNGLRDLFSLKEEGREYDGKNEIEFVGERGSFAEIEGIREKIG